MAVVVRAFQPDDETAFRDINLEWIEQFFSVEEKDRQGRGRVLVAAAIVKTREMGMRRVYLETNSVLRSALKRFTAMLALFR